MNYIKLQISTVCFVLGLLVYPFDLRANDSFEVSSSHGSRSITLRPVIRWPAGAGPFGVVIVVNSSAGASDVFLRESHPTLNSMGIAVAYLDTFTPRGIGMTGQDQNQISSTDMAIDAYRVAAVLRHHPRVRANRVAILGHSKGGITALHAATRGWRVLYASNLQPFDAAVALAPTCEFQFKEPELVSPLRVFLGEKDDYTPPAPCVRLFERMKSAGQSVDFEIISGAIHSWSTRGYRFDPSLYTARKCSDAPWYYSPTGFVNSRDGTLVSFREGVARCESRGASIGGPGDRREYVLQRAGAWLKGRGW
jgi:dienelactone hydrolase